MLCIGIIFQCFVFCVFRRECSGVRAVRGAGSAGGAVLRKGRVAHVRAAHSAVLRGTRAVHRQALRRRAG